MFDLYNQFKDFKSLELVFLNSKKEPQKIFCSVKSIEANNIVLNAVNQENKNIFAVVGDEVKLYIYTETGVYSATSKILLATRGVFNTEYVITFPVNAKHSQRREYFRAELSVDFHMCVLTSEEDPAKNLVMDAKTRNICGKGMSFITDSKFPEHEAIELDLIFPDKTITTAARLVYSKQVFLASKPKFIHAFTFTDISHRNVDFIVKQCFLHQLELKKKQMI